MSSTGKSRKRPPTEVDSSPQKSARRNDPLRDVVVCLTGLTHGKKIQFHEIIESLGGRYTREFDLDKNTHLIAETAEGAKYDLAVSCTQIHIVKPSWLLSCSREGKRVVEVCHSLGVNGQAKKPPVNVVSEIEALLDLEVGFRSLFECHRFYLLGFEQDVALKQKLGMLIRRGMASQRDLFKQRFPKRNAGRKMLTFCSILTYQGTIYWEMNEEVSMMILHDTCGDSLRKAAKIVTDNHINMPPAVSPAWVVKSVKKNSLALPSQFPPVKNAPSAEKAPSAQSKHVLSRTKSASAVFRGCLFSLARIAPPDWAVDFDSKKQEALIKSHGGQMLSFRLIDAMRVDASNGGQRRKCYVVCWGGRPQLQLNPFLSQLQRYDLCDIVQVTPIWLEACIWKQKRIRTEALPLALFPQPWPLRKLESEVSVALSGFSGTQKRAIAELIKYIGGACTDNMTNSNTHLICQEKASSLKVEKASQWSLHVVSIDWLQHIIEYGFCGKEKEKGGCEPRFVFDGATV